MQIEFRLAWDLKTMNAGKAFKSQSYRMAFFAYLERINHFVKGTAASGPGAERRAPATRVWLCDKGEGSKEFSSEELAQAMNQVAGGGTRKLVIFIGGPDGFSAKDLQAIKPDLRWSFGKLTLPHELAAVVAAEQAYRAWTILRQAPYHIAH